MATLRQGTSEVPRQMRGRKVILPRVLGTMVLLTFTVDFRVDFHCSKPPCLQSLLQQPENLRTSKKQTLFFWEWRSHHYSGSADRLVSLINMGNQITLLVQKQMTTVCKSLPSTMIFFSTTEPSQSKSYPTFCMEKSNRRDFILGTDRNVSPRSSLVIQEGLRSL